VHEAARGDFTETKLGDVVDVERVDLRVGGAALNAAVTFARQGLSVGFAGTVGHDTAGQAVLSLLDREGIDRSLAQYSRKYHTGFATILLAPNGERTLLLHAGAADQYDSLNVMQITEEKPDWIYVSSLGGNFIKLRELFEQCKATGTKVAFKPGLGELKQPKKLRPLLEDVEFLMVNTENAKRIVSGSTLDELVHHCLNLVPCAAITAGADGSIVSDGRSVVRAGLYEDVRIADKTGASDAFDAGLLAGLVTGKTLIDAVVFASANASSVVSQIGAQAGILQPGVNLHSMPIHEVKLR
jgi:sugar/nucleoside kinase (ribokinase family)